MSNIISQIFKFYLVCLTHARLHSSKLRIFSSTTNCCRRQSQTVKSVAVHKQKRQKFRDKQGQAWQVQGPGLEWTRNEQGFRDIGTVSGRDGTGPRFRRKMSGRTLSDVDKIVEHAKVRLNYRKQLIHETMCTVEVPGRRTPYPIQNCSSQERTCCLSPKLSPLT